MRPPARGLLWLTCLSVALAAPLRRATAETFVGPGFRVEIPPDFHRSQQAQQAAAQSKVSKATQLMPDAVEAGAPEVSIFVRDRPDGRTDNLQLVRVPMARPPVLDDEFVSGVRAGVEKTAQHLTLDVVSVVRRRLDGGLDAVEARLRGAQGGGAQMRHAVIPRQGFMLTLTLMLARESEPEMDRLWEGFLASLSSDAPPPAPSEFSEPSLGYRIGRYSAYVIAGLAVLGLVWRARRRSRPSGLE